ncbi:hydroquinone glucosyltransferase-like protein [Tanacetum coccineum]
MDHLIPLTELARSASYASRMYCRLFIIPTAVGAPIKPQNDILNAMPENISSISLPPNQTEEEVECLNWLDKHPVGSALFVSFGSGGTLSSLSCQGPGFGCAILGLSGKDIELWVYWRVLDALWGLVVPSWASQVKILSCGSTGGFLTHYGWNSTLKSVANRVHMIAWPHYVEQKMNVVLLTDGLGVACRVKEDKNGVVGKNEIVKCVRT